MNKEYLSPGLNRLTVTFDYLLRCPIHKFYIQYISRNVAGAICCTYKSILTEIYSLLTCLPLEGGITIESHMISLTKPALAKDEYAAQRIHCKAPIEIHWSGFQTIRRKTERARGKTLKIIVFDKNLIRALCSAISSKYGKVTYLLLSSE